MRCTIHLLPVLTMVASVLGTAYAQAATISISNVSISTAGTTGDNLSSRAQYLTTAAIIDSGESVLATIGAVADGAARFAMASETRASSGLLGTTSGNYDANYSVSFDVIADPTVAWDLVIDNSRIGRLLTGSGGGTGSADISASTGLVNGNPIASLALDDVSPALTSENGSVLFSDSGSTLISGIGTATYTLNFTWHADADSTQGFFAKGDKAGVLVGEDIAWGETDSQINYPDGATKAGEGHYVNFSATVTAVVPEPGTFALAALGAICFGIAAFKRSRR